jgi:RimJ/RimL family protein N-acetyltransferase
MSEADLAAFLQEAVPRYAQGQVDAGNWSADEAVDKAQRQYEDLLPQGLATENQYIYTVLDDKSGTKVGVIWFMDTQHRGARLAYVCEFLIYAPYRRQGYGTQAMYAAEEAARALGIDRIALHVFGHNHPARALYGKVGYEETNVQMAKDL